MAKLEYEPRSYDSVASILPLNHTIPWVYPVTWGRNDIHDLLVKKYHEHCHRFQYSTHIPSETSHGNVYILSAYSRSYGCVTNYPTVQWQETNHLLCSWILQFKSLNRAWQGQNGLCRWCLGHQPEGWGMESLEIHLIHMSVVGAGYRFRS